MKEFFKVQDIPQVFAHFGRFAPVGTETVPLEQACGRIAAEDVHAQEDLPPFPRSVVDGYAVAGGSTFGASEANPAYLNVVGRVGMGEVPGFALGPGEAARILTGGMLPEGADCVVMVEHTAVLDESTIEVYRSAAPGQNCVAAGEDYRRGALLLARGRRIRPAHMGVLAAFGRAELRVHRRPKVAIVSTGDEIVPLSAAPAAGQIRDTNTYSLSGLVAEAGGVPVPLGIVGDDFQALHERCRQAVADCDTVLISGGSSVGTRDFTVEVIEAFEGAEILVHGISISPGKPTILADLGGKALWGLPGHVVSAMVVFARIVRPFCERLGGRREETPELRVPARLRRNVPSVHGRVDFVRVRLAEEDGALWAEPLLAKSALIHTMVLADGLIEIDKNTEGLEKGALVSVIPL